MWPNPTQLIDWLTQLNPTQPNPTQLKLKNLYPTQPNPTQWNDGVKTNADKGTKHAIQYT